jgi:DNA-binding transcriptional LysR family regulator
MFTELKTLIAVARYGTFLAAGDKIGLTQSAVSGQIKRLEEQLGFNLFDRTGRSAVINAAGVQTLERAKVILALVDALSNSDDEIGSVRIGAIASQIPLLTRVIQRFREHYAKFKVHVISGLSLPLMDQVDSGELDFALIRTPFDFPPELQWKSLKREPYVLIAPASMPGDDWRELLQTQPFLRYDRLSFSGRQIDRFLQSLPFDVMDTTELPGSAMMRTVESGLGVAIVSLSESHLPLPPGVRMLSLDQPDFVREIGLVQRRAGKHGIAANYLLECFAAVAAGG